MENYRLVVQNRISGPNLGEIVYGCEVVATPTWRRGPKKRHFFLPKCPLL
jgi:hypothetical protein